MTSPPGALGTTRSTTLDIAMLGHVGNSVFVRGGLEAYTDGLAEALCAIGVRTHLRLSDVGDDLQLVQFMGSFYGLSDAFRGASRLPRVVVPFLLQPDRALGTFGKFADPIRSRLALSALHERRSMLRDADLVIAHSQEEADAATRYGSPSNKVRVVRGGVDTAAGTPGTVAQGLEDIPDLWRSRVEECLEHRPMCISIGRFESRKNHRSIVKACRALDLPLLLVGRRSPAEPHHLDLFKDLPGVTVWEDAPQSAVSAALRAASVHVLATRHETIGLVSLEAAVAGCRPVAIDQPTSREYLGTVGVLAGTASVQDLLGAVTQALARGRLQPEEQRSFESFSWENVATEYRRLYQSLL